jgi:ABC-2 type transport system permease protein
MANENPHWTSAQTRAQFTAIARLRWRITANQFRRKGGAGELVGQIFIWLLFAIIALAAMAFAGSMAFVTAQTGHLNRLDLVLWGIFAVCQFTNIQVGQPGTVFDPTQLIRFPMRSRTYIAIRLFFGLLSPANMLGALLSLAAAIGLTLAIPSIWFYAFAGMALFALTNALFSRMLFAWVDRWLSTRRAREVLTGCIFLFSIGIQWLQFTFNPVYNHHKHSANAAARIATTLYLYHRAEPFVRVLPPGLITTSLLRADQGRILAFFGFAAACGLFALIFFAIFAWRISIEFRGENLSDVANAVSTKSKSPTHPAPIATRQSPNQAFRLPSTVAAVIGKEFLQVRRNTGIFYGMIAPVVFVFIFAGKLATRTNASWIFPAALAYTLMGIAPLAYNSFGLEGAGSQFYFMAPIRLRDVFLAKNLVNFLLAFIEIAAVFAIISYVALPPGLPVIAAALLWAAATLMLSTTLGNRRSIAAPRKIDLGRTASKQASSLSGLISIGVLIGAAAIGAGFLLLAIYLNALWLLLPIFLALALGALFAYMQGLGSIDAYALTHRETLFEELCKK